jgi:hypothetical protein
VEISYRLKALTQSADENINHNEEIADQKLLEQIRREAQSFLSTLDKKDQSQLEKMTSINDASKIGPETVPAVEIIRYVDENDQDISENSHTVPVISSFPHQIDTTDQKVKPKIQVRTQEDIFADIVKTAAKSAEIQTGRG